MSRPAHMFKCYSLDRTLVYAGVTAANPWMFDGVASISVEQHETRRQARVARDRVIRDEKPLRNKPYLRKRKPRLHYALTTEKIDALTAPGQYYDGAGLMIRVRRSGNKGWYYKLQRDKRRIEISINPYPELSLDDARKAAELIRLMLAEGREIDEIRAVFRGSGINESGTTP